MNNNFEILDRYNVVWTEQSRNSSESMPVGGGDVGLNVWVEKGEILFYIGRSGTFDENNQMLKLGRVRIKIDPNPFTDFSQTLVLQTGHIELIGGSPGGIDARIKIWVEVHQPVVHVEIHSEKPAHAGCILETWRFTGREFPFDGKQGSRWAIFSLEGYPGTLVTYPDTVSFHENDILWYHRNKNDDLAFDKIVIQQELEEVSDQIPNSLENRTFGGLLSGTEMGPDGNVSGEYASTDFKGLRLSSDRTQAFRRISIYLHTDQSTDIENWQASVLELASKARGREKAAWQKNVRWWNEFWSRSHLYINCDRPDEEDYAWQIGRNYQLFRYMLACNAYGEYPSRFNGGVFTFDPRYITWHDTYTPEGETPDYRAWGNSFTAQNQRLVYWPLLKTGDFEHMLPQFEFYRKALPAAEARTRVYWDHRGCSFTEQINQFGLPAGVTWGWIDSYSEGRNRSRDFEKGVQTSGACRYEFSHQLDFSMMILEYHRYSGRDITPYLSFIDSCVVFYDEHYQFRRKQRCGTPLDEHGHLEIFPSAGCESFHDARNPADVVSGLRAVLCALINLPDRYATVDKKREWTSLLERIPPLPTFKRAEKQVIVPAENIYENGEARELPQMYALFPFNIIGLGKEGFQLALDTWNHGGLNQIQKTRYYSWYQGGIFTARLGLTDDAKDFAIKKLGDSGRRFPAFWGPGDDWVPDHNWGGSGMIGLQEMLMQTEGDRIYLVPAWPVEWDVDFKLHAPHGTIVKGKYKNGTMSDLSVHPKKREKDIIICKKEK